MFLRILIGRGFESHHLHNAKVAQSVEHQFTKLRVAGSNPVFRSILLKGELAQLARAPALHAGGHRFDSDILHCSIE